MLGIGVEKQNFDGSKVVFRFYDWEDASGELLTGEGVLLRRVMRALGYWSEREQLALLDQLKASIQNKHEGDVANGTR